MRLIEVIHGKSWFVAAGGAVFRINLESGSSVDTLRHDKCTDAQVISMTLSSDESQLFVGYSNKIVAGWDLTSLACISTATLRKQPTALQYGAFDTNLLNKTAPSQLRSVVLASDKLGEVFALDAPALKKQALVAGHTASVITDMALHTSSASGRTLVATADRDEKVRISHFPDMENISTFCMAHTKVVTSVAFVELAGRTVVLSTSWDHKLILWDASNGECLQTVSFLPIQEAEKAVATDAVEAGDVEVNAEVGADVEAGEGDAADGNGGEEADGDGEEDLEGKVYDELSAGNFPFKVVCNQRATVAGGETSSSIVQVAVLFKNSTVVKLFTLSASASASASATAVPVLSEVATSVTLAAPAVDATFTTATELSVVLPKPHGLQVFAVVQGGAAVDVTGQKAFVGALVAKADELGKNWVDPPLGVRRTYILCVF